MADDATIRDALTGSDGTADPIIPVRPDPIFPDPTAAGPMVSTPAVTVPRFDTGFVLPRVAIGEEALLEAERQLEAERELARQATERERQDRNTAEGRQRTERRAIAGGYSIPSVTGGAFVRPPTPVRPTDFSRLPPPTAAQWTRPQTPGSPAQGFTPPQTGPASPWKSTNPQAQRLQQAMQQWSTQAATRRGGSGSTSARKKSGSAVGCLVFIVFVFVIFGQAGEGLINLIKSIFDGR
ncbi:hypothetical protein ABLG96_04790 [Nakamurella sp. A5-74]|uniref:Uncharacterized protein n=1 Tax=Nakamurella sp. A5-74 TaxID=3158264 RepID=A0AAU8DSC1_9ACTN